MCIYTVRKQNFKKIKQILKGGGGCATPPNVPKLGVSNLYTFIGVKAVYIPHYVDIVRFNSKKFMNSGHSRI